MNIKDFKKLIIKRTHILEEDIFFGEHNHSLNDHIILHKYMFGEEKLLHDNKNQPCFYFRGLFETIFDVISKNAGRLNELEKKLNIAFGETGEKISPTTVKYIISR